MVALVAEAGVAVASLRHCGSVLSQSQIYHERFDRDLCLGPDGLGVSRCAKRRAVATLHRFGATNAAMAASSMLEKGGGEQPRRRNVVEDFRIDIDG